ncbi:SGNH/GDSL hydrolase family protein [Streptomyces sp. NPDC000927]|uniref:SGNH/GDSL hydrolase family protein n=1 Tax=Streptomyces sp. NPDC000927 TaxID=3154371 RepID=UPI00332C4113
MKVDWRRARRVLEHTTTSTYAALAVVTAGASALMLLIDPAGADQPQGARFAALGDSYSSGNGTTGSKGSECGKTERAYGSLVASSLGYKTRDPQDFQNTACANADTNDLIENQLNILGENTKIVTLTIGGNDNGAFFKTVVACGINPIESLCEKTYKTMSSLAERDLPHRLDAAYRAINKRIGTGTTVLVGGYPHGFGDGETCPWPVPDGNKTRLNDLADRINQAIKGAVNRMGPQWAYVDPDFTGHELCTMNPWVWGMENVTDDIGSVFHPNDEGHRQYARRTIEELRR